MQLQKATFVVLKASYFTSKINIIIYTTVTHTLVWESRIYRMLLYFYNSLCSSAFSAVFLHQSPPALTVYCKPWNIIQHLNCTKSKKTKSMTTPKVKKDNHFYSYQLLIGKKTLSTMSADKQPFFFKPKTFQVFFYSTNIWKR